MADDGKRSEAEWTLYDAGIEERGVPVGEDSGSDGSGGQPISEKWFQKWNSILLVRWEILGV